MVQQIIDAFWDRKNLLKINGNFDELYGNENSLKIAFNDLLDKQTILEGESRRILSQAESVNDRSKEINAENKSVQQQINNIILESGNTEAEIKQARGDFDVLNDRITSISDAAGFDPSLYGFSTTATWDKNRNALQKSNDYLKSIGGGVIKLPKGTFEVKGVFQDSNVSIEGNQTILRHPDGTSQDIIASRTYSTEGTIAYGKNTVTVSDASNIEKGTIIAIKGAGGMSQLQNSSITNNIAENDTTIQLDNVTGLHTVGIMWIENELIEYTGINGNSLTGVSRGLYGTNASTHSSGTKIGFALRLVAGVTNIVGNTLTLDKPATKSVSNVNVLSGIINPSIRNITFDGNLKPEGAFLSCNPVKWNLVRFGTYEFIAKNAESAIYLNNTSDTDGVVFGENLTKPNGTIGSGVWMFQNCHRNRIYANFTGDTWVGVYLDNRTSKATEYDGPCDFNKGTVVVNSDYYDKNHTTTGVGIVGGNHNSFEVKTNNVHTGFGLKNGDQVYNTDGTLPTAKGNHVKYNIINGYQPHVVYAPGNTISGYHETFTEGYLYDGNLKFASSLKSGETPKLGMFENGSYNSPSINFKNSANTGFYLIADGQVQFVTNSDSLVRFRNTGLFFADGKNLEFNTGTGNKVGTSNTQKIGFWGATPVVQPSKIGTIATTASQADIANQLNQVILALRNIGLIGNV